VKTLALSLFVVAAVNASDAVRAGDAAAAKARVDVLEEIDDFRRETWRWQTLMGRRRTVSGDSARTDPSPAYRRWVRNLWRDRALEARRLAARPPHRSAWLCIHRYEGGWKSNTGNGYYGGLQMDLGFQRTYGRELLRRKGTADRWTPLEQMWVGERALRAGRGFYPWPNAAARCGLL
jgi:Transglycosylase-like domain